MERELDVRGKPCPQPVLETKRALAELDEGVLTVRLDNDMSAKNVAQAAAAGGHEVVTETEGSELLVRIRKQAGAETEVPEVAPTALTGGVPTTTAVAIFSDGMGRGNPELGRILVKSYLFALSEAAQVPDFLLLANHGVFLALEGAETLESLRTLEDRGTQILVCGTCLDYLGVKDKLAVGQVSNMYDIAEALAHAGKVVSL